MCDRDASEQDVLKAGIDFLVRLYGSSVQATDLNTCWYQIFRKKRDPPKIKTLHQYNISDVLTYKHSSGMQQSR